MIQAIKDLSGSVDVIVLMVPPAEWKTLGRKCTHEALFAAQMEERFELQPHCHFVRALLFTLQLFVPSRFARKRIIKVSMMRWFDLAKTLRAYFIAVLIHPCLCFVKIPTVQCQNPPTPFATANATHKICNGALAWLTGMADDDDDDDDVGDDPASLHFWVDKTRLQGRNKHELQTARSGN